MGFGRSHRLHADEFIAWHRRRGLRCELVKGRMVTRPLGDDRSAPLVREIREDLADLLRRTGFPGSVPEPWTPLRIDDRTVLVPDLAVSAEPADAGLLEVVEPVLLLHLDSEIWGLDELGRRRAPYFSLPSLHDYLVVFAAGEVVHHTRVGARIVPRSDRLPLMGIGLSVPAADFAR